MEKKINIQFAILQTIAIIAVVVGHYGGANFFSDWFPIYQWHMPLFLFISGYFYDTKHEYNISEYLKKRILKLFIPCIAWNFIYAIISYIANANQIVNYGHQFTFERMFLWQFWTGNQWGFNVAAWFGLSLFFIQILYFLLRLFLRRIKIEKELLVFGLCIIGGLVGVKLTYWGYRTEWWLTLVKILFGLAVYEMGFFYKKYIEKYLDKVNNLIYFLIVFLAQFWLINFSGIRLRISMWNGDFNEGMGHCYTPFLSILPPIFFFIRLAKILTPALKNSKVIQYISQNTFAVMMHHIFVCFLFNYSLAKVNNICNLEGFDINKFRTNPYYEANVFNIPQYKVIYLIIGLIIPVLGSVLAKTIKRKVKDI